MRSRSAAVTGIALAATALVALALLYARHALHAALEVPVAGGDGGGLPLAPPSEEHLDAAALAQASADPAAGGLVALLVMRHGHLVFERFAHDTGRDSMVDLGRGAAVLVALLAGAVDADRTLGLPQLGPFDANAWKAAMEQSIHRSYAALLSNKVWSRLNAAPAWIGLPAAGAAVPADCCFHARVQDWLRVGALLTDDGRFEGTQVVAPSWVGRMRQPASGDGRRGLGVELASGARGGAFAADDVLFLRGPGHWRLWMSPSLHLVVLFGSTAGATDDLRTESAAGRPSRDEWDETHLPNLILDAVTDRSASQKSESLLQQLVPHH